MKSTKATVLTQKSEDNSIYYSTVNSFCPFESIVQSGQRHPLIFKFTPRHIFVAENPGVLWAGAKKQKTVWTFKPSRKTERENGGDFDARNKRMPFIDFLKKSKE